MRAHHRRSLEAVIAAGALALRRAPDSRAGARDRVQLARTAAEGYTCVGLFAGSGALGFEAASRGAARVTLVERHPRLVRQLRQTQAKLDARAIEIVRSDAMQ